MVCNETLAVSLDWSCGARIGPVEPVEINGDKPTCKSRLSGDREQRSSRFLLSAEQNDLIFAAVQCVFVCASLIASKAGGLVVFEILGAVAYWFPKPRSGRTPLNTCGLYFQANGRKEKSFPRRGGSIGS